MKVQELMETVFENMKDNMDLATVPSEVEKYKWAAYGSVCTLEALGLASEEDTKQFRSDIMDYGKKRQSELKLELERTKGTYVDPISSLEIILENRIRMIHYAKDKEYVGKYQWSVYGAVSALELTKQITAEEGNMFRRIVREYGQQKIEQLEKEN